MPDFRLSAGEAADLTAFLVSRRAASDVAREALPKASSEVRDRLLLESLSLASLEEDPIAPLDDREREVLLGEQALKRYGCAGCHTIPGIEAPAVLPLTPRLGWLPFGAGGSHGLGLAAELLDPDLDSNLDFGLDQEEVASLQVALLAGSVEVEPSFRPEPVPVLAAGREIVERFGCRGCHVIEGRGGVLATRLATDGTTPPDLAGEGARVRSDWLAEFFRDPGAHPVRPGSSVRMPTFPLRDEERGRLVRYFAALEDRPLFPSPPPPAGARERAVGEVAFHMLQCAACHGAAEGGAPSYGLASQRLRPEWVVSWILDPQRFAPGTPMPRVFDPALGDPHDSFLVAAVGTPMFRAQHDRLARHFDSEEELLAYLSSPQRVATALRDYLWTLEP